jgi:DeoR/GlpR family transcriptional regulator of sugar metabolism
MYEIRQAKIKDYILEKQIATIGELHELCPEVSLMTLHRDLDAIAKAGAIIKLRGGARAVKQTGETSFQIRSAESVEQKKIIAQKAIRLIKEGGAVFFDAGTTTLEVIRALPDINLTVITNGANFAGDLSKFLNITSYMCCGALNRSNMALSGQSTVDFLNEINIDLGFIGVSGYTVNSGFTCGKESEMQVKKLVIQKARQSVVLMDSNKLQRLMPYTFARLGDVDYVVGDGQMTDDFLSDSVKIGTPVI